MSLVFNLAHLSIIFISLTVIGFLLAYFGKSESFKILFIVLTISKNLIFPFKKKSTSTSFEEFTIVVVDGPILKHVSTKLVRELGITILLTAATGGDPTLVQEMIKTITSSGFDRSMEKEADMFAFELLQKANVKPSNLTKTFIRLNTLNPSELDKFDIFLSHPNLKTRIDYLSSRTLDSTFQEVPIPVQWETVQEITINKG